MWVGIAAGLAAGALWGLVFVAPRMVPSVGAVDFTAGRFVSYGLLAFALMLLATNRRAGAKTWPTWPQARFALLMSVLGFTGYYLLLVYGIRDAGTEVPSLIIGTIPLWMMILGKPVGLSWRALIPGLILTCAGLALMMNASHTSSQTVSSGEHLNFWRGVAFSVASMACWTAFGLLNATWLKKHPEVSATQWANWLGVATGLGALLLWSAAGSTPKELLAGKDIALAATLMVATGIGAAWLATILWNIASQHLSASLCGQLIVSETIFALIYSFVWDGQWPSSAQWLASILFVGGILASIRAHR